MDRVSLSASNLIDVDCFSIVYFPPTTQIEANEWEFGLTPLQDHPELVDISGDASSLPQCTPFFFPGILYFSAQMIAQVSYW